jgi:H+/Cl- antiporter ClcA
MKILPSSEYDQILKYSVYWLVISIVIGVVAGLASTLIFVAFDISNKEKSASLAYLFLPFVGFGIGYLIKKYGSPIERGTHLLIDEIHQPKSFIPKRMSPIIFITSILTQLFGGSAGERHQQFNFRVL